MSAQRDIDDTRYCPMCEDAAKKILELEQRQAQLRSELFSLASTVSEYLLFTAKSTDLSKAYHSAVGVINQTPQQTAAQIERGHIEWMMKLPVVAIGCEEMARDGKCSPVAWLGKYPADGVSLVAIPPLPKESNSPETDLDEALRRQ